MLVSQLIAQISIIIHFDSRAAVRSDFSRIELDGVRLRPLGRERERLGLLLDPIFFFEFSAAIFSVFDTCFSCLADCRRRGDLACGDFADLFPID